jgi:ATP-dependent HslUV protease ATP-binding subunit HslU
VWTRVSCSYLRVRLCFFLCSLPVQTEIARRLARLTQSPFVKVEATKFTEVGFHGRDVESIIQDLVRVSIASAKARRKAEARVAIKKKVSDKLLAALTSADASGETFRDALEAGQLEAIEVEVEVPVRSAADEDDDSGGRTGAAAQKMGRFIDFMRSRGGPKTEVRKLPIGDARPLLEEAEMEALVSTEEYTREAIQSVQDDGIVFIDEIDKIASSGSRHSADASAEGVQRDLLPLLEGTTVTTKQGDISTDHILFICSGAFHAVKPSDLLAELQGRLPIRVELQALTEDDLYRVISATENSLVQQQTALMEVDHVKLVWKDEALREIAKGMSHTIAPQQRTCPSVCVSDPVLCPLLPSRDVACSRC